MGQAMAELLIEAAAAKLALDEADAEYRRLRAKLCESMGDADMAMATGALDDGREVVFRLQPGRRQVDEDKLGLHESDAWLACSTAKASAAKLEAWAMAHLGSKAEEFLDEYAPRGDQFISAKARRWD